MSVKYKIYPTLLDGWQNFIDAERNWNTFYADSDKEGTPTVDEFIEKEKRSLLDRINRVPFESEAADKGTAFNMIVDSIVNKEKPSFDVIKLYGDSIKGKGNPTSLVCCYKSRAFTFDYPLVNRFADYYKGALNQMFIFSELETKFGDVLLYGYIDELMSDKVCDIKTTKTYKPFKFENHFQHLVYPYCLIRRGCDIHTFEYNITDFKAVYKEVYTFNEERDIPQLKCRIEGFISFLENNRNLITDKKIFAQDESD